MNSLTERVILAGPAGALELAIDQPEGMARGIALIAHPHPLFGGTLDNKVVQTIARAFLSRGMICVRPNFRGVGQSTGSHDNGQGEQDDLVAAWSWAETAFASRCGPKRWAAGFSFGAVMTTHIHAQWETLASSWGLREDRPSRTVLVGLAAQRFEPSPIDGSCRLIHGECDEVVSLQSVFDFARKMKLPVTVLPGAGHFFHGQLIELRELVCQAVIDD